MIKQKMLQQLLTQLPVSLHSRAFRYRSDLSKYNYIIGRLLLKQGLDFWGLNSDLEQIRFQQNGKPVLAGIDFNISHSDHHVICGFAKWGILGLDIEKINPIDFEDFTSFFSTREWDIIKNADDPIRTFYWFWTRKESIIKALGHNLSYLNQIELDVSTDHFVIDGKRWFLQDVVIQDGYMSTICSEKEIEHIEVVEIRFI
ncbi:MAG: 4'-phosphopantetheinyl transferase superfamily protein [Chitinophagales bacterium]|nr:4'-phosphopantetheinyl transferase superfamily protein [Chitinophagales bacterium]